ncbi:MAG: response regulator [Patescibacteria group bacterium]|uniref:Response regulator n=1 Tax=candidate division WWE3 bacterium TaxID=2053526 RepID=A0A955ECM8_UNCKA|nr:response regulator [candidate division WWE3 bacterium]
MSDVSITKPRVLIAEDETFLANAYRVKLEKEGMEVIIAKDGKEAFDLISTQTFNLIILDLIMPNIDGFNVLEKMSKSPKLKVMPVIVASNLGQQEDIDKAKSLGAQDFIIKSNISMSDLVAKVQSYLN